MENVAAIINALGGSAAVSRETEIPLTTIESWKSKDFVPVWRRAPLLALAQKEGVPLTAKSFPARGPKVRAAA